MGGVRVAIRLCTYNIEWFDDLFDQDNDLKDVEDTRRKVSALKEVSTALAADLIGVVEAPNTTVSTGHQSTEKKLQAFLDETGQQNFRPLVGFVSAGRQELAILYNAEKLEARHSPGGSRGSRSNPPFDGEFFFDTDDDRVKEAYRFYRPPLEAEVTIRATGQKFHLILVHTKSKGIFDAVDLLRWERENARNRRKLYAECSWIRRRADELLEQGEDVVVMGDFNDGPGMDYYELSFGRSAVEIVMGDIYNPQRILRNPVGRPRWTRWGWEPSSARFTDRITGTPVNVLIDHILVSRGIPVETGGSRVWNPFQDDLARPLKRALLAASDHFPVTLDVY
jgi:endonuclease/exonuclease/phosphatase family metal-dependent hydrolase